jgi:hypothetical protein
VGWPIPNIHQGTERNADGQAKSNKLGWVCRILAQSKANRNTHSGTHSNARTDPVFFISFHLFYLPFKPIEYFILFYFILYKQFENKFLHI